jgi:hypothetical protein
MTYRFDLQEHTRALLEKIQNRKTVLQHRQKELRDALEASIHSGRYYDMGPLNSKCLALMDEILHAERELSAVTDEKRRILGEAGLAGEDIRAGLDDLPMPQNEFQIRCHGMREPDRSELMRKMIACGLVRPFEAVRAA